MHAIIKKIILGLVFIPWIVSCTMAENYFLGKDNAPKPRKLQPIEEKKHFKINWSSALFSSKYRNTYLKLKPAIDGSTIYTANDQGIIKASHTSSGETVWLKTMSGGFVSGPVIGASKLFLGSNHSTVVALDRNSGKMVWEVPVSGDVLAAPLVVKDKLIVKTVDGNVYGLDLATGKTRWVDLHGAPSFILQASSSPVVLDSLVLIGFPDGKLDAIDIQSGQMVWQRSIAFATGSSDVERLIDIDADPIVRGRILYLATYQGYIGALYLDDGQFIWSKPDSIYKSMDIGFKHLYVTDAADYVKAYDLSSGALIWKQKSLKARGLTEPVVIGNDLLIGDKLGFLHLIDKESGLLKARVKLDSAIDVAPLVRNQMIYVLTRKGQLTQLVLDN